MELLTQLVELAAEIGQAVIGGARSVGWAGLPPLALAGAVFLLRTVDQAIAVNRTLAVLNGQRGRAWILGMLQALFFVTAVSGVIASLDSPLNMLAFAGGYAMGAFLGLTLERRHPSGHSILRIISPTRGAELVARLRERGYGVTELSGAGRQGTVSVILCALPRRNVQASKKLISRIDPAAFITVQQVRVLGGGWESLPDPHTV